MSRLFLRPQDDHLVVIPSIWQPFTDECVRTLQPTDLGPTLVVDNTTTNRGVARAWNTGLRIMMEPRRVCRMPSALKVWITRLV